MKKCLDCFYWRELTAGEREDQKGRVSTLPDVGLCRRYPTTLLKSRTEWCGEYEEISPINKALLDLEEGLSQAKSTD